MKGAGADLAARLAPKDREPTAAELWQQRALLAEDQLDDEDAARARKLIRDVMRAREEVRAAQVLIDGRWKPNPHKGDTARAERRSREIWREYGELLGVGPPPWPAAAYQVDLPD